MSEQQQNTQKISVVIHGHFYQPPRENPWTRKIAAQESANPYHDWNERISAECYQPNTQARVLDEQGQIVALSNNFERVNFNIGPTLFS
jgi:alpha-amylase/alpha-mannosidase (GH57 family)